MDEVSELQQQLQSSEREKVSVRQHIRRKEAELTRAQETIERQQQRIQEMRAGILGLEHLLFAESRKKPKIDIEC